MHILYADESGSAGNYAEACFVLGGVSVFERGLYHLITAADDLVKSFAIGEAEEIELHGSRMYNGSHFWRKFLKSDRERMICQALDLLVAQPRAVKLFAIIVDKKAVAPRDPIELSFEEICNRFNLFLSRQNNDPRTQGQRGLLVMDDSKHEQPLQQLARRYRVQGGRWGHFKNLAEVPMFIDSRASRLVQLADLVAFATWRKYEHQDGRFFDRLKPLFDTEHGIPHGLVHYKPTAEDCYCHACYARYLFRVNGRLDLASEGSVKL